MHYVIITTDHTITYHAFHLLPLGPIDLRYASLHTACTFHLKAILGRPSKDISTYI